METNHRYPVNQLDWLLDDLVVRLVHAGVAVRELAPVISPLEAAFLALTEKQEGDR